MSRHGRRQRAPWIGAMAAVGLLLAPASAAAEEGPDRERAVLDGGHLDLAARLDGAELTFQVKDGTVPGQSVWREPDDVILHFDARHAWEIPASAAGRVPEELGEPGDTLWVDHSVTYAPGLLWPGWSTEEIPTDAVNSPITATFTEVTGPDGFFLGQWRDHPELGSVVGIDIDGTRAEPGAVELRPGVHAHPLWFFTEEGVYRLRLELSTTLPTGERVHDTGTLTAVVGDTDPDHVELPTPEAPPVAPPVEPGDTGGGSGDGDDDDGDGDATAGGGGTAGGATGGGGTAGGSDGGGTGGSATAGGATAGGATAGSAGTGGGSDGGTVGSATSGDTTAGSGATGSGATAGSATAGSAAAGSSGGRGATGELAATGGDFVPLGVGALLAAAAGLALLRATRPNRHRTTTE
ncbi:choice-of-anchor M domain-containing protein [Streptomyces profundus]|uniref:choice-of-anchor M domain-containing protein n=1 Tax=Streptomyces profundus TaxID=2867410 RepID=UPI001D16CE02|nr:choice-of-anchor M domain-containing protein [Streptomyces sp. MA3_2.13]UED86420.1 choice-of-anchor M domain-containing protein [Streptomyces sp. MA3_2.13]